MFIETHHDFDASTDEIVAALFHPGYLEFIEKRNPLLQGAAEVRREQSDTHLRRVLHYKPVPSFERLGPVRVRSEHFEFLEEGLLDRGTREITLETRPVLDVSPHFRNRTTQTFRMVAQGRTRRLVRTEIRLCDVPVMLRPLRGVAEEMMARQGRKMAEAEATVLADWLEELARGQVAPSPDANPS